MSVADPLYSQNQLLVRFDGYNNHAYSRDRSKYRHSVQFQGTAKIVTAQSPYAGGSSLLCDGSGYCTIPHHVSMDSLFAGDFCVEGKLRIGSAVAGQILRKSTGALYAPLNVYFDGTSILAYMSSNGSSWNLANGLNLGNPSVGTWVDWCVDRSGSSIKTWLNGVAGGTAATSTAAMTNSSAIGIGAASDGTNMINAHMADIRIVPASRHQVAYTPESEPKPAGAYKISGNITESLAITRWRASGRRISDSNHVGDDEDNGDGTYDLWVPTNDPYMVMCEPYLDGLWVASLFAPVGYMITADGGDGSWHIWRCTTEGTTGGTEPTWNLSGTTNDGTVVWTYVGSFAQAITHGPLVPV